MSRRSATQRPGPLPAAAVLLALLLGACSDGSAAPAATWPEDTVLAVGELPILAAEVDRDTVPISLIEPAATTAQLRRLALNHLTLPRSIGRMLAGRRWQEARELADKTRRELLAGTLPGPMPEGGPSDRVLEGGFGTIGLAIWGAAFELAPGEWSPVVEEAGAFHLVRLIERHAAPRPAEVRVKVALLDFPYLEKRADRNEIEEAMDRTRLLIVDPSWRTVVPEHTQYRMGVHDEDR